MCLNVGRSRRRLRKTLTESWRLLAQHAANADASPEFQQHLGAAGWRWRQHDADGYSLQAHSPEHNVASCSMPGTHNAVLTCAMCRLTLTTLPLAVAACIIRLVLAVTIALTRLTKVSDAFGSDAWQCLSRRSGLTACAGAAGDVDRAHDGGCAAAGHCAWLPAAAARAARVPHAVLVSGLKPGPCEGALLPTSLPCLSRRLKPGSCEGALSVVLRPKHQFIYDSSQAEAPKRSACGGHKIRTPADVRAMEVYALQKVRCWMSQVCRLSVWRACAQHRAPAGRAAQRQSSRPQQWRQQALSILSECRRQEGGE